MLFVKRSQLCLISCALLSSAHCVSLYRASSASASPVKSLCLFQTQVLHEETTIPGTDLKLSYLSSRAAGYKSVLKVTMTQATIPFNLMKVHLMVAVVGRLFQKWFPASPNLAYTFIWDKTDAYNQKVYGLSEAVGKFLGYPLCTEKMGPR